MITIIGPSGNGKSTLADAFGFIADCLELGLEAACDANNRGGYDQLISQGVKEPISFEIYYERTKIRHPSHMNWRLTKINMNGLMSKWSV